MTTPAENDSRPEEASRLEDMPELPAQAKSNLFANLLCEIGLLFTFTVHVCLAAITAVRRRRLAWREAVEQMWFLAHVTAVASALVMIPLGVGVALQIGSLADQIGAGAYSGAVVAFLIIGQAGPLVCALIAGVGGSAICADLGARTIREEWSGTHQPHRIPLDGSGS
ncbi:ABC transporter permease [Rhodococcus sp. ARC_M6]|uniref:MlaE family ABC transporter permease n=1 Tax=Rhodococcus sp. ARC_M6 TaxID=2928852 RepID=UPI001FB32769|nr:ABC transporter permease [Rhodococcus sp. ARC_M6]MCJ0904585.1 ABC transporter permease [Rhodococcus sp. ARC_M6]